MKNFEIINIKKAGIDKVRALTIPSAHAYKVCKFKKAVNIVASSVAKEELLLMQEAGIDDAEKFNNELAEALKAGDAEKVNEMKAKAAIYNRLQAELYNDEAELAGVKPMPYEVWHDLQCENRNITILPSDGVDILTHFEALLEGVLWEAPEE